MIASLALSGTSDCALMSLNCGDPVYESDRLATAGVIPVFTTIMPRDDSADADLEVPRYNAVVRAVAGG